ncbi:flavin containing amine oxidoreductase [Apiospora hydei]|uniref:Amine oxidase n=1 Tax=Apiospora hydei TaxID=1337664 RepID=A0ABR1UQN1_9PEZI
MATRIKSLDLANTSKAYYAPATIIQGNNSRLVHVSGQVGTAKDGTVPADCASQIHLALLHLRKILIAAGAAVQDIAKLTLYIVDYDPAQRKHARPIQRFLKGHRPAITLVPVTQLAAPGLLFEVDAVIVCPEVPASLPAPTSQKTSETFDVAIIGAGLAGLTAAHEVLGAGLSCVVLEARDRVGGKTWSQPLSGGQGGVAEMGAAWINDVNQTKMIALARRYKLELIEQNTTGNCVLQSFDGKASTFPYGELPRFDQATLEDVARIRDMCEADCQALDTFAPKNTELDSMTFEAYLRSRGASETSLATATVWTRAMLGAEPSDMSALFFLNYCRSGGGLLQMRSDRKGGGQHLRIRQGTQSFAEAFARDLPAGTVRLNKPVARVVQDGPSYVKVVDTDGATYRVRKLITTVPSPALSHIDFTPRLHPAKEAWSQSAGYGFYTKAIVVFKRPFWVTKGLCGLAQSFVGPASVIRDTSSPADDKHALTCFMSGPPGQAWAALPEAERNEKLLEQLGVIYADRAAVDSNLVEVLKYDWADDRWAGYGCPCASLPPGVLDTLGSASLREPLGNLHFAGTETAGDWKGYMEGAVRSGERAAKEVVGGLSSAILPHL